MSNIDKVGTATAVINQKEYLKKYLNIGADKDKKKKKKRSRIMKDRLKIIDDNIDVVSTTETLTVNELNEFLTQEDAPQVVGMIDDRPLALRLDDYRKNSKWKLVGSDDEQIINDPLEKNRKKSTHASDSDKSPPRRNKNTGYDSDLNPNRAKRHSDSDISPPRVSRKQNYDSDASPPRKDSYKRQKNSGSDARHKYANTSPPRRSNNTETSPPRKKYYQSNKNSDSDASPVRKNQKSNKSPPRKKYYQSNKDSDSDASPNRRDNLVNKVSVSSKTTKIASDTNNSDNKSSVNRSRKSRWAEPSPPRNIDADIQNSLNRSPKRGKNDGYEVSPIHSRDKINKNSTEKDKRKDRYEEKRSFDYNKPSNDDKRKHVRKEDSFAGPSSSKKMEKTLDGKTAGLQNAKDLKHETVSFKRREDDLFKKMTEETSGMNAAPIIRDRKTGKKRDFEKEAMEEFAKLKREKEQKQKYDKWGKGLKQVGDLKERVESDIHEMNKPLARYADDADLETYLKEQERDGDPMLQYIKKKKQSQAVAEGKTMRPVYDGEFMSNRFGVPPGHRWDGVDRSNGYEKQWFAKENAKKAVEEEIYKWSTEDM